MSKTTLEELLVGCAQEGRGDEIACGMMAMSISAAILCLGGDIADDGSALPEKQRAAVNAGLLATDRAIRAGTIAAEKLIADAPFDVKEALAMSIACSIVASVRLNLCAKACGATPMAAADMVAMAAQKMLRDLDPTTNTEGDPA